MPSQGQLSANPPGSPDSIPPTRPPSRQVIVFFTTARLTQYMAALMAAAGLPVLEIHSRKSQVREAGAPARVVALLAAAAPAGNGWLPHARHLLQLRDPRGPPSH